VLPTAPNLKVPIAFVIRAGNNGTLFIRPSHFPDISQINDVQLTSPTTGQTLIYNASTGVWSNQTPADPSPTNELQTLSTGTNTLTLSNGGGTVTVDTDPASDVTGSGANGRFTFWTGAQTVSSDAGFTFNTANYTLTNGQTSLNTGARYVLYGATANRSFQVANNWNFGGFEITPSTAGGGTTFTTPAFTVAGATSNVGIGINTASARLHVVGSGSTSTTWTAQFHNSATGGNNALMIRDDGRIGIGSASPTAKVFIRGEDDNINTFSLIVANASGTNVYGVDNVGLVRMTNAITFSGTLGFLHRADVNGIECRPNSPTTITAGTKNTFEIRETFSPTSGTGIINTLLINPSINQTGGANGITRGINITPGLTSAANWRSIEWNNNAGFGLHGAGTATNYLNGNLGIRTTSPTDNIDINGANGYSQLRLRTAYTPTGTADANGNTGDVSWDDNYIYIKTAAGWKRSALSTF
jgi:hypothetical protein